MAEKKITPVETKAAAAKKTSSAETVKKAAPAETAPKKKTTVTESGKKVTEVTATGNAGGLRAGAIICWVLAIVCELVGILAYFGKINVTFVPTMTFIIGILVLDLIFVIVGSRLWVKANHIDPASEKNKVKFFLWNNMGVIVCIVAFLPYLILLLKDKDKLDPKTKKIAVIAALAALLIGSACSIDYNPVSEEQKAAAVEIVDGTVYWTKYGKVYHTSIECQALNNSDNLFQGEVDAAIENNKSRLCAFCAKRDNIEGVATNE